MRIDELLWGALQIVTRRVSFLLSRGELRISFLLLAILTYVAGPDPALRDLADFLFPFHLLDRS